MADGDSKRPTAEKPRGFRDRLGAELLAERRMLDTIRAVYESYGFDPLETPAIELADALGKFLPDQDRPNEGVFAFRDDDEQWLSLRYDLTAPLARFVAENYDSLPKPFRRYQVGQVFRNEKPGPGRYREFTQFDADTVGTASMLADAELCMMLCDVMDRLGLGGDSVVKVNNRKILNGLLEAVGIVGQSPDAERQRLGVLRAIDKLDRLGVDAVGDLLGAGRKDESGDFTKGANLSTNAVARVIAFTQAGASDRKSFCNELDRIVEESVDGRAGVAELRQIDAALTGAGYDDARVRFDPSVVRGLAYYTGPVIEAELTFQVRNEDGQLVRFGSVAGGGRYDDLVTRFKGVQVPATGISIGVSRLLAALASRGGQATAAGPVVVLVMDKDATSSYMAMAKELRQAGLRAEVYAGTSGMKAQLKYADKRQSPVAVIEGSDERAKGVVTLKDLELGAERAKDIKDRDAWAKGGDAQVTVARADLVAEVKKILAAQKTRA
ncbi:MAG: histidine--tRNA ligase [Alphaproteobacteria bacterium]|nr:histidine--tRNA ligase [Alphaproteobacteria bacterium]